MADSQKPCLCPPGNILEAANRRAFDIMKLARYLRQRAWVDSYGTAQKTSICTHSDLRLDGDGLLTGCVAAPEQVMP